VPRLKNKPASIALLTIVLLFPPAVSANDLTENAGIAVGVTAGNMWFVPIKAISVVMGLSAGALSFVVTGGNAELTRQIWQDSTQEPFLITPDVANRAIGERPEIEKK